jgi:protein-disulfide isomerase
MRRPPNKSLFWLLGILLVLLVALGVLFWRLNEQLLSLAPPAPTAKSTTSSELPAGLLLTDLPPAGATFGEVVYGDQSKAKVVVVEYSDLECPYCRQFHTVLAETRDRYREEVAVVFRHFPLDSHVNAPMEARVVGCLAQSNSEHARTLIDLNFAQTKSSGKSFTLDQYLDLAVQAGGERTALAACEQAAKTNDELETARAAGRELSLRYTPTSYLVAPGQTQAVQVIGTVTEDILTRAIEYLRAKAQ